MAAAGKLKGPTRTSIGGRMEVSGKSRVSRLPTYLYSLLLAMLSAKYLCCVSRHCTYVVCECACPEKSENTGR